MPKKRATTKSRRYADDAPLTAKELRTARPARAAFPELVAAYEKGALRHRGQRGPQKTPKKVPVSIRLSPDVLTHFKATGNGWQTRLDDALRLLIGQQP
jgi:uncharacterized protein (DUF4415 family)